MSATNNSIPALDGEGDIPAYVARPDADTTRAIIVIPEIFGVNEGIRKKADDWAAKGYLAAAPDIFWRFAEGDELALSGGNIEGAHGRVHFEAEVDIVLLERLEDGLPALGEIIEALLLST